MSSDSSDNRLEEMRKASLAASSPSVPEPVLEEETISTDEEQGALPEPEDTRPQTHFLHEMGHRAKHAVGRIDRRISQRAFLVCVLLLMFGIIANGVLKHTKTPDSSQTAAVPAKKQKSHNKHSNKNHRKKPALKSFAAQKKSHRKHKAVHHQRQKRRVQRYRRQAYRSYPPRPRAVRSQPVPQQPVPQQAPVTSGSSSSADCEFTMC